jgi:glycosyltransferase involved in cell wall biosynthesis
MTTDNNKLTIIIPFLNEGFRIEHTVKSIRKTQTHDHEIILINDVSTDEYDYKTVADNYNCVYVENETRIGVAESRSKGVNIASNQFIILFDGHMTLPEYNWDERILEEVRKDTRAIYCTKILVLDNFGKEFPHGDKNAQAAHFQFDKTGEREYLECKWSQWSQTDNNTSYIPSILGATYCFHKDYFNKLWGLVGLKQYGADEQFLSIKCWLEGGTVKLINNVKIGHWFRDKHPYEVNFNNSIYNKVFVVETCAKDKDKYLKNFLNEDATELTCQKLYEENLEYMQGFRNYFLNNLFTRDFEFIEKMNAHYLENKSVITEEFLKNN